MKTLSVQSFSFENRAIYDTMWKNTVEPGRPQTTIWHMCINYSCEISGMYLTVKC